MFALYDWLLLVVWYLLVVCSSVRVSLFWVVSCEALSFLVLVALLWVLFIAVDFGTLIACLFAYVSWVCLW